MQTILADSHRLVQTLKSRGFSEQQAEGVKEAILEIDLSELASRRDLKEEILEAKRDLKEEILSLELRMTIKMGTMIGAGVAFLAFLKFF